jgi:16S rRNA processing protein RimM
MKKEYLECARVVCAHGVRGAMKLEVYCDSVKVLTNQSRLFSYVNGEYVERKIINACSMGEYAVLTLEGFDTREAAQAEKGKLFYLHRNDIPVKKGDMLIADMIGLPVIDFNTGAVYGEIIGVFDAPRSKIYTVKTKDGKEVLYPSGREFIKELDEMGMKITPIPGFFD